MTTDSAGNELMALEAGDESLLTRLDPAVPLPLSLVVARRQGRILLVLNRWRQEGSCPAG